jgi:hypothetical protein
MNRETLIANYLKKFKEHNDLEEKMKKSKTNSNILIVC